MYVECAADSSSLQVVSVTNFSLNAKCMLCIVQLEPERNCFFQLHSEVDAPVYFINEVSNAYTLS